MQPDQHQTQGPTLAGPATNNGGGSVQPLLV